MEQPDNLHMSVQPLADLNTAIDRWLTARGDYKKQASHENEHRYNETYYALGAAWAERHPDAAYFPGAFELFRRGLISPETDG